MTLNKTASALSTAPSQPASSNCSLASLNVIDQLSNSKTHDSMQIEQTTGINSNKDSGRENFFSADEHFYAESLKKGSLSPCKLHQGT